MKGFKETILNTLPTSTPITIELKCSRIIL